MSDVFIKTPGTADDRIPTLTHKRDSFVPLSEKFKVGTRTRHGCIQKFKWGFDSSFCFCFSFPFNLPALQPFGLMFSLGKLFPENKTSCLESQDFCNSWSKLKTFLFPSDHRTIPGRVALLKSKWLSLNTFSWSRWWSKMPNL